MFVLDFLVFLAHMGFIEIPLSIKSSILELSNGGQGRHELNGLNVLIQTDEEISSCFDHGLHTYLKYICGKIVRSSSQFFAFHSNSKITFGPVSGSM